MVVCLIFLTLNLIGIRFSFPSLKKSLRFSYPKIPLSLIGLAYQSFDKILLNKYVVDFDHPVWGKIKEVGFPVAFSKTPASIRKEAPMHGQHTEEVLMEILEYTWEDIEKLKDRGVI